MIQQSLKISARCLLTGDQVGSGETIASVSAGVRTPCGKGEVTFEKTGQRRTSLWGPATTVSVSRSAVPATAVAVKIGALGLILI
jgi:hypothetical protein